MTEVTINAEKFFQRIEKLQTEWQSNKGGPWQGSDALCVTLGAAGEDVSYSKASSFHIYLFGYEFPDSLIVLTRNNFYFMSSQKKCSYLDASLVGKNSSFTVHTLVKGKDEDKNREHFNHIMGAVRKNGGKKLGALIKLEQDGNFVKSWSDFVDQSLVEKTDIAPPLGVYFAAKDEAETVF
jgi:nucleosome binding factor SPN SPT16 subunit